MANKTAGTPSRLANSRRGAARAPAARGVPRAALVLGFFLLLLVIFGLIFFTRARRSGSTATGVLRTSDFHSLAFSPSDPNVVFFGHHNGIMQSKDGGRTWSALVERPGFDGMALAVSRDRTPQIFLAGHDVFEVSPDNGVSWQPVAAHLPGTDIHGFAVSPDNANRLYAFVAGQGGFQSTDGGRMWQPFGGNLPNDVMALAAAGGTPETLYASSMGAGLLRSTDGGQTWLPAMGGMDSGSNGASDMSNMASGMALAASGKTVFAGRRGGLYKSTDGGTSWSKLSFPAATVAVIGFSPTQPDVVLAITVDGAQGLVYRSADGGQTWSRP